jgi:hypothetical protein
MGGDYRRLVIQTPKTGRSTRNAHFPAEKSINTLAAHYPFFAPLGCHSAPTAQRRSAPHVNVSGLRRIVSVAERVRTRGSVSGR